MEMELLEAITSQGLGAIMSVALMFYIIKNQEKRDAIQNEREANYQKLLSELSMKFEIIKEIQEDLRTIKDRVQ